MTEVKSKSRLKRLSAQRETMESVEVRVPLPLLHQLDEIAALAGVTVAVVIQVAMAQQFVAEVRRAEAEKK